MVVRVFAKGMVEPTMLSKLDVQVVTPSPDHHRKYPSYDPSFKEDNILTILSHGPYYSELLGWLLGLNKRYTL